MDLDLGRLSGRKLTLGLIYVEIRQRMRRDWAIAPKGATGAVAGLDCQRCLATSTPSSAFGPGCAPGLGAAAGNDCQQCLANRPRAPREIA